MKKTARLDQILIRLGYATPDDIERALERQRARGGRLGRHLRALRVIDEEQLVEALAVQFDLPWVATLERDLDIDLLERLPPGLVLERMVLPLELARGSLTLLAGDPLDLEAFERARETLGADRVVIMLAPENLVRELGERHLPHAVEAKRPTPGIELPELFDVEAAAPSPSAEDGAEPDRPRLLMVLDSATHRNFLPPVFEREGRELTVVSTPEQARDALGGGSIEQVLVARSLWEAFGAWIREGRVPRPEAEVTVFPSVSGSLLENPAPYDITVRSLRVAVQALADQRSLDGRSAPYGLMAEDLAALGRRYGMRRLALDGMHLAVHLLVPAVGEGEAGGGPFSSFPTSLELASSLRFPFRIDALLGVCHALFRGRIEPDSAGRWGEEIHLAAQMLALVWYRHTVVPGSDEARQTLPGAALRGEAGALASLELIEVYLRIIADRGESATEGHHEDVLLVGQDRIARTLATRLRRMGCRTFQAHDLDDAFTMVARQAPVAVIVDDDAFEGGVARVCRDLNAEGDLLLYVLTDSADASRTLALLDAGAHDVFGPPHDFDLVSARVSRTVRTRARIRSGEPVDGGRSQFSASLEIFSFLDLVQTLSHSRKSVRIEVRAESGEEATVYTHQGRIVHALCGDLMGEEAVYRVIAWEDDGAFVVYPESDPPAPTIHVATDAVLMEGCRLLDESKV